jgi:hypothetical protein
MSDMKRFSFITTGFPQAGGIAPSCLSLAAADETYY